jgi:PKD repeat protein
LNNPIYVFSSFGQHEVTLTITTENGCIDSVKTIVDIYPLPLLDFDNQYGNIYEELEIENSSSIGSGIIQNYYWFLSDVFISEDVNPIIDFDTSGLYEVSLIGVSDMNCSDTITKNIVIFDKIISLVCPIDSFVSIDPSLIFEWNTINSDFSYNIQISTNVDFSDFVLDSTGISANFINLSLPVNETYYWRVRGINEQFETTWTNHRTLYVNDFIDSSLKLWLMGDYGVEESEDTVSQWLDRSLYTNNASQFEQGKQPVILDSAINNLPSLKFDGVNDFMEFVSIDDIRTVVMLIRHSSGLQPTSSYPPIFGHPTTLHWSGTSDSLLFSGFAAAQVRNGEGFVNGIPTSPADMVKPTEYSIYAIKTTTNAQAARLTKDREQAGGNTVWQGEYVELLIFNQPLAENDMFMVESYLRHKYSPPVNLGPDISLDSAICSVELDAGSRFTSLLWSNGSMENSISINSPGIYHVQATDIFGYTSRDTIIVTGNMPVFNQLNDTTLCVSESEPNQIVWNTDINNSFSFLWHDGSTNNYFIIDSTQNCFVKVTDIYGCTFFSDTILANIDSFALNSGLGSDFSACSGNQITLTTGQAEEFLWSDGSTGEFFTVENAGTVWLNAVNERGCTMTDTVEVLSILGVAPTAGFDFENICVNQEMIFTDTSFTNDGSNIVSWLWDFGNAESSSIANPQIFFGDTGVYQVRLTVETDAGCDNFAISSIRVHGLPQIAFSPTQHCANDSIVFSNSSQIPVGEILSFAWNFNDGNSSNEINPEHIFNASGYYNIELIAVSDQGCADTLVQALEVKPAPVADFSYSTPCAGSEVDFSDISYMPSPWSLIGWQWTIDGMVYYGENVSVLFDIPDTITVSFNVQAVNGCWNSAEKEIIVFENPKAGFTNLQACLNSAHTILDTTVTPYYISTWFWEIENIGVFSAQNPEFEATDIGNFEVKLTVIDQNNCVDFVTGSLDVNPSPSANFSFSPWFGIPGSVISFSSLSSNYTNLYWDFGDGNYDDGDITTHSYSDSGNYEVMLVAENVFSCFDTIVKSITVINPLYDVAVLSVTDKIENNKLSASVIIANFGSIPLYSVDLKLDFDKGSSITETFTGEFLPGTAVNYTFASQYEVSDFTKPAYVCVEAELTGGLSDAVPENNIRCNTDGSLYELLQAYPNPTNGEITFEVILPYSDVLIVDVYESGGKLVKRMVNRNAVAGLNRIVFDASVLAKGVYNVWFNFEGSLKNLRFVRN